jgi:protein-tyrosine-phosphatase
MRLILEEMGYNPDNHRSQGISEDLLQWADEIICMGTVHMNCIADQFPKHLPKVSEWLIKDPHFAKGDELHREVAQQIACRIKTTFS